MKRKIRNAYLVILSIIFSTAMATIYFSINTPSASDFTLKANVEGDFSNNINDVVKVKAKLRHEKMGFRSGVFSPNKISIFLLPKIGNSIPDTESITLGVSHTILPFEQFERTIEFVVDFSQDYVILVISEFIVNQELVSKSTSFEIIDGKLQHIIALV